MGTKRWFQWNKARETGNLYRKIRHVDNLWMKTIVLLSIFPQFMPVNIACSDSFGPYIYIYIYNK